MITEISTLEKRSSSVTLSDYYPPKNDGLFSFEEATCSGISFFDLFSSFSPCCFCLQKPENIAGIFLHLCTLSKIRKQSES